MDNLEHGFFSAPEPPAMPGPDEGLVVVIKGDSDLDGDFVDGALKTQTDDGGVEIDLNPQINVKTKDESFDANLAELLSPGDLGLIGSTLMQAIESDNQSRMEWLQTRANGIEMLGFKVETARGDTGAGAVPVEGMSTVRNPLLTEAVIRFQSNASAELYPAEGPVKVREDTSPEPPPPPGSEPNPMGLNTSDLAEALERDLNHYLTKVDKGYRPDSVRMLFWVGFGGCGFKKVYNDPIRRMPLSRSVDAADLMEEHRITSVLVVDAAGALVGALNSNDLMRAKVI